VILAEWTSHPAKSRPRDAFLCVSVFFITTALVMQFSHSLLFTALAILLFAFGLAPFLFPTRYTVTDEDISERRLWTSRSRRWSDLRRADIGKGAALLSPFQKPQWLDRHRGIFLLFDGCERDEVVALLLEKINER
jgi:hypothetical protein